MASPPDRSPSAAAADSPPRQQRPTVAPTVPVEEFWLSTTFQVITAALQKGTQRPRLPSVLMEALPTIVASTLRAMSYYDWTIAVIAIAVIATQWRDRKAWYNVTMLHFMSIGIALFTLPHQITFFVRKSKFDAVELHSVRCFGACLLALAVMQYRLRHSAMRDQRIYRDMMLSRALYFLIAIPTILIEQQTDGILIPHRAVLETIVVSLMAGAMLYHIGQCDASGGLFFRRSRINTHLLVDNGMCVFFGLVQFGYPGFMMSSFIAKQSYGPLTLSIARHLSIAVLSHSIVAMKAVMWTSQRDKQHYFIGRMLSNGASFLSLTLAWLTTDGWPTSSLLAVSFCMVPAWLNALLGFLAGEPPPAPNASAASSRRVTRSARK